MKRIFSSIVMASIMVCGICQMSFAEEVIEVVTRDGVEYALIDGEYVPLDSLETVQQEYSLNSELAVGSCYLIENTPGSSWSSSDPSMYTVSQEGNYTKLTMVKPGSLVLYVNNSSSKGTINISVGGNSAEMDYGSADYKEKLVADVVAGINAARAEKGLTPCGYSGALSAIADRIAQDEYVREMEMKRTGKIIPYPNYAAKYNLGQGAPIMYAYANTARSVVGTLQQKWPQFYQSGATEIGIGYVCRADSVHGDMWCETVVVLR